MDPAILGTENILPTIVGMKDLDREGTEDVGLTDRDVGDLVGFLDGTRVGLLDGGDTLGSKLGLDVGRVGLSVLGVTVG